MPTALLTRAALLACVGLACSPKSGETEAGTSTTVSQPGTSADPSSPMPNPTTGTSTTTTTGEDTGPVGQCALEHDVPDEECDWFYTGYYFDPVSQTCQSFGYGDCGTPVVPFETLEACLVECEGCETDCSTSSGSSSG